MSASTQASRGDTLVADQATRTSRGTKRTAEATRTNRTVDQAISVLTSPLVLPPLAVYAATVWASTALLPKKLRRKARATATRLLETGPWGNGFDYLTWQPWVAAEPQCVLTNMAGEPRTVPLSAIGAVPDGHVRVVVVSDTHGKHEQLRLPQGDVLVHCGDILSRNSSVLQNTGRADRRALGTLHGFNRWLGTLPHAHRIVIGGNHDAALEGLGARGAAALLSNATYLQDEVAHDVCGLRVGGSPWSNGKSANRAFQRAAPLPLRRHGADAPAAGDGGELDLLVMHSHHAPTAAALRPRVYATGHAHEAHGVNRAPWGGLELNASICDGLYRAVQLPVVVDIPRRRTASA